MFPSLAFSDFQRFAIIFHLSPSWWREVVGHFKVKPRHCLSVEGFSFRLSVPQMFICEFIFCTENHFLLNFSVIDVYCRKFGKQRKILGKQIICNPIFAAYRLLICPCYIYSFVFCFLFIYLKSLKTFYGYIIRKHYFSAIEENSGFSHLHCFYRSSFSISYSHCLAFEEFRQNVLHGSHQN